MAISFVASAQHAGTVGVNCPKPTGTVEGDLMVAGIVRSNNYTDGPAGWTRLFSVGITNVGITWAIWYKIAGASEPTSYFWDEVDTGWNCSGTISTYRGASGLGASSTNNHGGGTATDVTALAITTTKANSVVYAWFASGNATSNALTTPAGTTYRAAANPPTQRGVDFSTPTVGTTSNYTSTLTNAAYRFGSQVELLATNAPPNAPTLTAPSAGGKIAGAAEATFSWTHSDPDGDAQNGYAFRRRVGTGAYEYWNAGTQAWTSTEVINSSSTQSVTFPGGKWANGTTYNWSVATRDTNDALGAYSAQRNVTVEDSATLSYTGASQTYVVPENVTQVTVETWGAQGAAGGCSAGLGGYAKGVLSVTPGETLSAYVGGQGSNNPNATTGNAGGGWNGGGHASATGGGGGGGATDVRQGGTALANRVIVAGGGGGGGRNDWGGTAGDGGSGGGTSGGQGGQAGANGGTQTAAGPAAPDTAGFTGTAKTAGSLDQGGVGGYTLYNSNYYSAGGGGGGYYGGGGGAHSYASGNNGGGGGGSSYLGGVSSAQTLSGQRTGHGQVVITAVTPPSLIAPADKSAVALTSGVSFQWSSPIPQSAYALYRRAWGSATKEWWNAGTAAWQTTEVFNSSTATSFTLAGANWPTLDGTYYWSVATRDAGGTTTLYASEFVLNPWEIWDGSNWVVTESPNFVITSDTSVQAPKGGFISGNQYAWSMNVKDSDGDESGWTAQTLFTFGGVVPREGWGQVFI